ncbi:MAG: alpha-galactosidase [Promethearchaeota archaeon]
MEKKVRALPLYDGERDPVGVDWLVVDPGRPTGVFRGNDETEIVLSNGLIRRVFRVRPNGCTVAFDNLVTGEPVIRGVKPEAVVELDGNRYNVGGLVGQVEYAYLRPEWVDSFTAEPGAFSLADFEVGPTRERFAWKMVRYAGNTTWPPAGRALHFKYLHPDLPGVEVGVHYEVYDGIPLCSKWLTVTNDTRDPARPVRLSSFTSEVLAAVEVEGFPQGTPDNYEKPNIHVETDYAFSAMSPKTTNNAVFWVPDPQYTTQVPYSSDAPFQLEVRPPIGPDVDLPPGETFESFRAYELPFDSWDRERKGLAQRRMYRTIAPWATENPILMHVRSADPERVKVAVDQCAEVGFEMVVLTFGSGFNIEWAGEEFGGEYVEEVRDEIVEYAHSKGIEVGGYSLLASRTISEEDDVVTPEGSGGPTFGHSPCLGSAWGQWYFQTLYKFFEETGMDLLEHDGSYPGDLCASTSHPGHRGLSDSQWTQWKTITDFYKWCRGRGVYLNVPDWYFLSGSSKTGMGYKEVNWSLPRERQVILARQNIYDGTWEKTPSMGWMFTPLTVYHQVGNWKESTLEPLSEHLEFYEWHLAQNFGSGVQSCYRGPRLYDSDETKAVVKKWVDFYKRHRAILDSDIVHVRRPDGRDVDCILHVNPFLEVKGLAMVYNPLDRPVHRPLKLPLYYTGLTETARISERDGEVCEYQLDRHYNVKIPLDMPPNSVTWYAIR